MSDLILDMTPTSINRTAIYHIALDTARALGDEVRGFRYGTTLHNIPVTERPELDRIGGRVMQTILADSGLIQRRWGDPTESAARVKPDDRVLFFDPLYVLFDGVRAGDIVLVLDLTPVTNPEWHQPRVCELYRLALRNMAMSGAKVAAISRSTAQSLWANYGVPVDTVTVVQLYLRQGLGSASAEQCGSGHSSRDLLFVGSLETRKNITGLIRAFDASGLAREGYRLMVAGGNGAGADEIKASARGIVGVELKGFVSDDELQRLYRTACGFVYPSYLEGFGVPILEAAHAGLPILTSITGAPPEVAPPGSILVDPYDTGAIVEGLRALVSLPAAEVERIAAVNRAHAASYTLERYTAAIRSLLS